MPIIDAKSKKVYSAIYKIADNNFETVKKEDIYTIDEINETIANFPFEFDIVGLELEKLGIIASDNSNLVTDACVLKLNHEKAKKAHLYKRVVDSHNLEPLYLKNV